MSPLISDPVCGAHGLKSVTANSLRVFDTLCGPTEGSGFSCEPRLATNEHKLVKVERLESTVKGESRVSGSKTRVYG